LKAPIEISFIDQFGQEEAGIDGGGVFKEFFASLCKEVFDTDRGLWLDNKRNEKFKAEILPIKVKVIDPKTDKESEIVVNSDDGIRDGVTVESLGKLKPSFSKTGSTHAGNASQISDGSAAVLLARRSTAKKLGLPIVGKYVASTVVGVPPRIMGVGTAYAVPKILKHTGLHKDDIDFFEINEAFASQAVYSVNKIGIPFEK